MARCDPAGTPIRRALLALAASAAGWLAWDPPALAIGPSAANGKVPAHPGDTAEAKAVTEAEAKARAVGLAGLHTSRTAHYVGIGNAPARFQEKALSICEQLALDYLDHFRSKGFPDVEQPAGRLVVVLLADAKDFAAFSGRPVAPGEGGYYERDSNRLVVFDNRVTGPLNANQAKQANLVSLAHEAMHQLTYNTGLLNRRGDVPVGISEGLAMYAEVRKPNGRTPLGQANRGRCDALRLALQNPSQPAPWIPVAKLLSDDQLFEGDPNDPATQLAYAESWLLVDHLMRQAPRSDAFRKYLEAIRPRTDASQRLQDARATLGDLNKLDQALRRYARRLMNGR